MSTAIALRGNGRSGSEPGRVAKAHLDGVRRAAEALRTRERVADDARLKLHERIFAAAEAGESKSAISRAAGVSRQWISHLLDKR
jgi:hypothetical protein